MSEPSNRPDAPATPPAASSLPAAQPAVVVTDVPDRRGRVRGWKSGDVVRAAALIMAMYVGLRLVWVANPVFLLAFLGVLFGLTVSTGVDWLERRRIPRGLGAAGIVLGGLGLLIGFFAWTAPILREQGAELRQRLPEAIDRVEHWVDARRNGFFGLILGGPAPTPAPVATPAPGRVPGAVATDSAQQADSAHAASPSPDKPISLRERVSSQMSHVTRYLFPFLSSTIAAVSGFLIVLVLSVYIAADPETYRRGIMHLFPCERRERAGEVLSAMATVLRRWMVTQLIAMTVIGVVSTVVLFALHVKAAVALGVLAGLFEFIPTVGPILSAVPAIAMGFLDSPQKAIWVAIAYVAIQQLENHVLIPLLMKGGIDLPPALTILSQALMALVFGFLGLMVAVPLVAATMVPIKMLYVEGVVGDEVSVMGRDDPDDPPERR